MAIEDVLGGMATLTAVALSCAPLIEDIPGQSVSSRKPLCYDER